MHLVDGGRIADAVVLDDEADGLQIEAGKCRARREIRPSPAVDAAEVPGRVLELPIP